ncbi:MAG: tRNA epoxyqueuosine(34) reductase QueG [Prevotellaceae bacterium]|nr:tRNA epoxyqueuosine(34) reductase QueG [Prevotellaceae bacterium]
MSVSEKIKTEVKNLGFDACGFADAEPLFAEEKHLKKWLNLHYNASMVYMENYFGKRISPKLLYDNANSVIVVLLNYKPEKLLPENSPQIAKYAYGIDYHFVIKEKLRELLAIINSNIVACNGVAFVDSAPVLERALAVKAGLGWIGKNSMLINPKYGSYTLIGELLVDIKLDYDKPIENRCGNCFKCINSCPAQAIVEPKIINANRCISYLTIEHKGEIDEELKSKFGNRLFGCDTCIDACPYNNKTPFHYTKEFMPNEQFFALDWQNLTQSDFNKIFKKSPLKRAGYRKLCQNN